jgi:hypothetical protein
VEPNEKSNDPAAPRGANAPSAAETGETSATIEGGMGAGQLLRPADVRGRTGITHQVLYRYVTLGLVEPAGTTASGQRLYHPSVVPLIRAIQLLTKSGYSLRSLKEIFFKDERVRRAVARAPRLE